MRMTSPETGVLNPFRHDQGDVIALLAGAEAIGLLEDGRHQLACAQIAVAAQGFRYALLAELIAGIIR